MEYTTANTGGVYKKYQQRAEYYRHQSNDELAKTIQSIDERLAALEADKAKLIKALDDILINSIWDGESREDDEFLVTGKMLAQARATLEAVK